MKPEYVDASDLIQPDTRSDAQKWLDAEMDKRWANEQGAEPYPILEAIALQVIEENQRLRAQIGQGEPDDAAAKERDRILSALKRHDWHSSNIWRYYYPSSTGDWVDLRELRKLLASTLPAPQQKPPTTRHDMGHIKSFDGCVMDCVSHQKGGWTAYVYFDQEVAVGTYLAPQATVEQQKPLTDERQIAEALRKHGFTLVKTATGYDVLKLGPCIAHNIGEKK